MAGDSLEGIAAKIRAAVARFGKTSASAGGSGGLRVTIVDHSKASGKGLDRVFEAFDTTMDQIPQVLESAVPTIRAAHRAVFDTEGAAGRGAWAPLAPSTIRQRLRLGYGAGPILVRTGALRDHVLSADAQINRVGGGWELRIEPGRVVAGVPKYYALAMGRAENNLPGRPMVAIGPAEAVKVTSGIQRALRARAIANGL